jgi:Flp pilus assembly protein CpaB
VPLLSADLASTLSRWPRRLAALVCLLIAAVSAVMSRRPATSHPGSLASVAVAVAAHDLATGQSLRRADLSIARWPPSLVPQHAVADPARLVGRRVAGPLGRGEPITTMRLVGADLAAGLSPGQVAVPVSVADPTAGVLVRPGDAVDLIAAAGEDLAGVNPPGTHSPPAGRLLVSGSRVLAVLRPTGIDGQNSVGIIVATDRTSALRIAGLAASRILAVRVQPP